MRVSWNSRLLSIRWPLDNTEVQAKGDYVRDSPNLPREPVSSSNHDQKAVLPLPPPPPSFFSQALFEWASHEDADSLSLRRNVVIILRAVSQNGTQWRSVLKPGQTEILRKRSASPLPQSALLTCRPY